MCKVTCVGELISPKQFREIDPSSLEGKRF